MKKNTHNKIIIQNQATSRNLLSANPVAQKFPWKVQAVSIATIVPIVYAASI